jgi:hypothetical protein
MYWYLVVANILDTYRFVLLLYAKIRESLGDSRKQKYTTHLPIAHPDGAALSKRAG